MALKNVHAYLSVADAPKAIDFYNRAFGAHELFRLAEPSGRIGHAELDFGGTRIYLADEFPEYGVKGPTSLGGTPVSIHLQVDDADAVIASAVAAGATLESGARDQFHGERSGAVVDPFGHRWLIGHTVEEVDPEEMQRRYAALFEG